MNSPEQLRSTLAQAQRVVALQAALHCELFLSIGTSTQVYPAAELPFMALEAGATVVEINPHETPLQAHYSFRAPAGEVLPELLAATKADTPC